MSTHFSAQFVGMVIFRDLTWIAMSFIVAGLGNALHNPALSAIVLDITPPEQTAGIMGLKATAGSLGSMLGPAPVVLFTASAGPQIVFLIAITLMLLLTLASGLALRVPKKQAAYPFKATTAQ